MICTASSPVLGFRHYVHELMTSRCLAYLSDVAIVRGELVVDHRVVRLEGGGEAVLFVNLYVVDFIGVVFRRSGASVSVRLDENGRQCEWVA